MGSDESESTRGWAAVSQWILPIIIVLIALIFMLGGDNAREGLRFDRVWLIQGEGWRWFTGHLSHLGWSHFALNSVGLLLVWFLVGARFSTSVWLVNIAITLLVIDAGFWFLNPELHWYVGLSGLLHGLLAAGIVAKLREIDVETGVLALLVVGKLIWEQVGGPMPGSELTSGGPVVVDAHLYGTFGGVLAAVIDRIRARPTASI